MSKAMLAQRNGLTKATISAICDELAALNLIRDAGQDRSRLGRPGNLVELNARARSAIGLEISTNYVAVLLTDFCGQALWRRSAAIAAESEQETVLGEAEALLTAAIEQAQQRELSLLGIGVAAPGSVDSDHGMILSASALGWRDTAADGVSDEHS